MHGSAFHPPLQDMKSHVASGNLSMDWLARAGLLFHRTSGKNSTNVSPQMIKKFEVCNVSFSSAGN